MREITPVEIILYSVFLYLCRLSLRDVFENSISDKSLIVCNAKQMEGHGI
ncbi:MAG: hypothetical protein H5T45_04980 [Thermoplasmatales archaeon]|nr:hypothetical protein [Thermoplasmatales archaeon]